MRLVSALRSIAEMGPKRLGAAPQLVKITGRVGSNTKENNAHRCDDIAILVSGDVGSRLVMKILNRVGCLKPTTLAGAAPDSKGLVVARSTGGATK